MILSTSSKHSSPPPPLLPLPSLLSTMASSSPSKPVFFPACQDFPAGELPTRANVIAFAKHLYSTSHKHKKKLVDPDIVEKVTDKVLKTWTSANQCFNSLVSSSKTVYSSVKRLLEESNDFVWGKRQKKWRDNFELNSTKLFDILRCSCHIFGCSLLICEKTSFPPRHDECGPGGAETHYSCVCVDKSNKIPQQMLLFVRAQRSKKEDQSSVKILDIQNIDVTPLAERKRAAQRERAEAKRRKSEEATRSQP